METAVLKRPKAPPLPDLFREGVDFLEQPVVPASAIDRFVENEAATKKFRHELIQTFHWPATYSYLGRRGRLSLNHTALLGCLATFWGWGRERALELGDRYNKAGLADLVNSGRFAEILHVVDESLPDTAISLQEKLDPPRLLNETLQQLVVSNSDVRSVAQQLTEIANTVDRELSQVHRHFGYVERIEGEEAVSLVKTRNGDELRAIDTKLLEAVGSAAPKAPFILYEFKWAAGKVVSFCAPAVLLRANERQQELKRLEAEQLAYETPLPQRTKITEKRGTPTPTTPQYRSAKS
jgi:hypothetical protein